MTIYDDLPRSSLQEIQSYIGTTLKKRGFSDESVAQKFMLFMEEIGEFAQAARKHAGVKLAVGKTPPDLADEAGDVLILFLDICNTLGIDAAEALSQKERKNSKRVWVG